MTHQTYPDYKPSGIDWIGDIPSHWELKKLKYNTYVKARVGWHGLNSEEFFFEGDGAYCVTGTDFKTGSINWKTCYKVPFERYEEDPYIQLEENDLLITKDGTIGKVALVKKLEGKATLNSGVFVVRPKNDDYSTDFLHWILQSSVLTEFVNYTAKGSTIIHLYQDTFINLSIALPPLSEQAAIATYLDEKTAQLDGLIARKRRLMALLREEKAALINEAVTKGIRPNVPMKASDIEWLGNVPAHWEMKKLKHVATVRSGFALNASAVAENTIKIPYLRVANVQDGYLKLNDVTEVDIDSDVAQRYLLRVGDLLMNEGGDNDKLGRGCVWNGELDPCLHQNHVFAVRMNKNTNVEWINILTTTSYARQYFMLNCKQSTNLASISQTNIRELPVLMPPVLEQIDILAYLNAETAKIDFTVSRIEREIELMQEYRTALISEVVTGKVNVMAAQPVNA